MGYVKVGTENSSDIESKLKLQDVALTGFSMGAGEVARYIGKFGTAGIRKAVIVAGVPPYLLKAPDNPEGHEKALFDGIGAALLKDRFAFFREFFGNFYNATETLGKLVSQPAIDASWNVAAGCSATAAFASVSTWYDDFRSDLQRIDIPTLVIHGDSDRILPIAVTGDRTSKMVKGAEYVVIKGAPHGLLWTHSEEVNSALVKFLA